MAELMKHLAAATLCLCSVATAQSPKWNAVFQNGELTMAVDPSSVKLRDGELTAWVLYNYVKESRTEKGFAFRSSLMLDVYDCTGKAMGVAVVRVHAREFGQGDSQTLKSVDPDKFVCVRTPRR